jgi:hypothetical protein
MKQYLITPAAGKRLIARALASHPLIKETLQSGTLAIIAGTTNGYVAEEILSNLNQMEGFSRKKFFRGIVLPPGQPMTDNGRIPDEGDFIGDVIIKNGLWQKGATIFDAVDHLKEGDIVLKGANALDLSRRQAGILIGDPFGGTIGTSLQAVVGRRVRLILPVGLEKRVPGDLNDLAVKLNAPGASGPRLLPVPGEIFTEIEAISLLTGAKTELVAGGGVNGAEGSIWLAFSGAEEQVESALEFLRSVLAEPPFRL